VLPVTAATLVGPWRTALVSAGAVIAYVAIAAAFPESRDAPPDALGFESAQTLFLAWVGLAAVLLSSVLTARARQIQALADSRGRLVAQGSLNELRSGITDEASPGERMSLEEFFLKAVGGPRTATQELSWLG